MPAPTKTKFSIKKYVEDMEQFAATGGIDYPKFLWSPAEDWNFCHGENKDTTKGYFHTKTFKTKAGKYLLKIEYQGRKVFDMTIKEGGSDPTDVEVYRILSNEVAKLKK